jgi:hypothetical protein
MAEPPVTAKAHSASPRDESIRVFCDTVLAGLEAEGIKLVDVRSPQKHLGELAAPPGYEQEGASRTGHIPARNRFRGAGAPRRRHVQERVRLRELYYGKGVTADTWCTPRPHRRAQRPQLVRPPRTNRLPERQTTTALDRGKSTATARSTSGSTRSASARTPG